MKKVLVLPAIIDHISIIKRLIAAGCEVITVDNIPSNPAHAFAHKNYDIDLLDYESLISMAREESIDAVWGYSTDIGALAAAKITDALHLNGNSFNVVETMSDKSKFRAFLQQHAFNCPSYTQASALAGVGADDLSFPVVVKPVDRASSKGISIVQTASGLTLAFQKAQLASLGGQVIIEEYLETKACQLHGDAVVADGEIVLFAIGDQYFSATNPMAPIGTVLPSCQPSEILKQLKEDVQRFVSTVGFVNGGINIEARIGADGKVFIVELGPRSGGNYVPELISHYVGVDVQELLLSCIIGITCDVVLSPSQEFVFQFIWRSSYDGKLLKKSISDELDILEQFVLKQEGDRVSAEAGADNIVAILILKAQSRQQVEDVYIHPEKYFDLSVL